MRCLKVSSVFSNVGTQGRGWFINGYLQLRIPGVSIEAHATAVDIYNGTSMGQMNKQLSITIYTASYDRGVGTNHIHMMMHDSSILTSVASPLQHWSGLRLTTALPRVAALNDMTGGEESGRYTSSGRYTLTAIREKASLYY